MVEKNYLWAIKLDWLNILSMLNLDSIDFIPEIKRERAMKNLDKNFGTETLLELEPDDLDTLIVSELRELMKKELSLNAKKQEKVEKEMRSGFVPFKNRGGGIFKIDARDFKDLDLNSDAEEIMKYLQKKFMKGFDDSDTEDDDEDNYIDDGTGYYI